MEIADAKAHLALAYIAAASDNGHRLTREEFEAYISKPRLAVEPSPLARSLSRGLTASLISSGLASGRREQLVDYLERVQWAVVVSGRVHLTTLGRAILRHLETRDLEDEGPLELVLDDELAYARAVGLIAAAGKAALVDRFFELEQLTTITFRTEVTRVLTGPNWVGRKGRTTELAVALASMKIDRPFEIRCSDQIHDRFVIPDEGRVRTIGSSLNHVGQRLSVTFELSESLSETVRAEFEQAWKQAQPLAAEESADESAA
jgi:hypothetical protein